MKEKVLIRSLPCLHLPTSGKQILTVFYLLFINNNIINQRICRSVRHSTFICDFRSIAYNKNEF